MEIYWEYQGKQRKKTMAIYGHIMKYHIPIIPPKLSPTFTDFHHPKTPCFQGHQGLLGCGRESGAHPREASEEAAEGADAARCQVGRRRRRTEGAWNEHLYLGVQKGQHSFE